MGPRHHVHPPSPGQTATPPADVHSSIRRPPRRSLRFTDAPACASNERTNGGADQRQDECSNRHVRRDIVGQSDPSLYPPEHRHRKDSRSKQTPFADPLSRQRQSDHERHDSRHQNRRAHIQDQSQYAALRCAAEHAKPGPQQPPQENAYDPSHEQNQRRGPLRLTIPLSHDEPPLYQPRPSPAASHRHQAPSNRLRAFRHSHHL